MKPRLKVALLFIFIIFSNCKYTKAQGAKEYYISLSGDDANNGLIETPWRTIEYGISQMDPGDTLIIREGEYYEKLRLEVSGTPQNPIIIRNYPGETPLIIGREHEGNGLVISASNFKLIGLTFQDWDENAIWIESSQYFDIINCTVYDVQYGIGVADDSHDFTLRNCAIHDFTLYGYDISPVTDRICYNALIMDCIVYHGSDPEQNVDGFAIGHGAQRGFTVVNCTAIDVYDGFDISSDETLLTGCYSIDCWNTGYKLWGDNITLVNCIDYGSNNNLELDWSGTPKTVTINNSDFINSNTFSVWVENKLDKIRIFNTIIAGGKNIAICFENGYSDSYTGDFNLLQCENTERIISIAYEREYSLDDITEGKWSQETGQDSHSIVSSEIKDIFIDLDNMNLYPAQGSIVINSGDPSKGVPYDYMYNTRDEHPDIGAFEYNEAENKSVKPIFNIPETIIGDQPDNQEEPQNPYTLYLFGALILVAVLILFLQKVLYKS